MSARRARTTLGISRGFEWPDQIVEIVVLGEDQRIGSLEAPKR